MASCFMLAATLPLRLVPFTLAFAALVGSGVGAGESFGPFSASCLRLRFLDFVLEVVRGASFSKADLTEMSVSRFLIKSSGSS